MPPSSRGRQEKEGRPNRGGRRVQEGKDSFSGLLRHRRRRRRKGRSPHLGRPKGPRREGPSFRTTTQHPLTATRSGCPGTSPWRSRKYPDTIVIHGMFYCTASPYAEYDYADRPKPVSTYPRRAVPWTHRIWIAIHFQPPPPPALRTTPRCCLKGD